MISKPWRVSDSRTSEARAFASRSGQLVGIRELQDKIWLVSFMHYDLGFFDHEIGRVECADNPFEAKLLPMSSE
jgi:putative transposase